MGSEMGKENSVLLIVIARSYNDCVYTVKGKKKFKPVCIIIELGEAFCSKQHQAE